MNNVNLPEMQKFVKALQTDASLGKKNKRVTGSWSFKEGVLRAVGVSPRARRP